MILSSFAFLGWTRGHAFRPSARPESSHDEPARHEVRSRRPGCSGCPERPSQISWATQVPRTLFHVMARSEQGPSSAAEAIHHQPFKYL